MWVQKLGGLHFPKEQPQVCTLIPSPSLESCTPIYLYRLQKGFAGFWGLHTSRMLSLKVTICPPSTQDTKMSKACKCFGTFAFSLSLETL